MAMLAANRYDTALHPLDEAFARVRSTNVYLTIADASAVPTLTPVTRLLDPGDPTFRTQLSTIATWYKTDLAEVLVRFFFGGYCYYPIATAVTSFALTHRLPDLTIGNVSVGFGEWGSPSQVGFQSQRFFCLPDDADAGHPDATIVPDLDALRNLLRTQIESFVEPMCQRVRGQAKIGQRSLWIGAAENCVNALAGCLEAIQDEALIRQEIDLLVGDVRSALRAKPTLVLIEVGSNRRLGVLGDDCCNTFKIEGNGYCGNCPHRSTEERIAALTEWVAGLPVNEIVAPEVP